MRRIELPGDGLSDADMRALQDAVALSRASGQARSEQITGMFDQREWFEIATFAAFDCQKRTLGAKPWEPVPMHVADPARPKPGEEDAAALLGEMLARGISRYHPDPRRALAVAEKTYKGGLGLLSRGKTGPRSRTSLPTTSSSPIAGRADLFFEGQVDLAGGFGGRGLIR